MKKNQILTVLVIAACGIAYYINFKKEPSAGELEQYNHHLKLMEAYENSGIENIKDIPKKDRPDLAFLQDFENTKDPKLGYPPSERRFEAYRISKEKWKQKAMAKAIDNVVWEERGPNNVGGRTRALMFDPNDPEAKKVWAGSISGGLWYNKDITDPLSKWVAYDDLMSNLAISCIVSDPNNPSVFYVGTGEGLGNFGAVRGTGIFKSSDGGSTWNLLNNTNRPYFHAVQKIQVTNNGTVIAATRTGVFRSVDGGNTWVKVIDGRGADIEMASDGVLFVSTGIFSEGFIHKSKDDGVNWTDITPAGNGRRIEMAIAPSNKDVVYAVSYDDQQPEGTDEVAFFVRSDNQGDTWRGLDVPGYMERDCKRMGLKDFTRGLGWHALSLGVMPNDKDIVIVGAVDLYKSMNGGQSWGLISYWTGYCDDYVHADNHITVFRPGHPTEAIFGTDGGVFYSKNIEDGNPSFEARNNSYNVTQFYSVAVSNEPNRDYYLGGTQDNGTLRLTSSGTTASYEVTGGDGGYCFIDQLDPNIQITSSQYANYYLSQDGGASFGRMSNDDDSKFINPTAYDSESKTLYAAGESNQIKRIELSNIPIDMKTLPVALGGSSISHIKVSPFSDDVLYVGTKGSMKIARLSFTSDGIIILANLSGNLTSVGTVSSIDIGASEEHLLATMSNYGIVSVYETTDGGITWENKEGNLPDMPVRWGIFNPNNRSEVLLATEVGVWSTDDITVVSPEWEPTNAGLANVRCDMIKYREADRQVVVATYGRGIFTSNVFSSKPNASFNLDRLVAYTGIGVNFTDASQLPNNSWAWSFGDGSSSLEQNPSYTYSSAGTYEVTLSIGGGASSTTKSITVLPTKPTPYGLADGGDFETNPTDFAGVSLLHDENLWELGTPSGRLATTSSGVNAWKTDLDGNIKEKGYDYKFALYTPSFDLSDASADYTLRFKKSGENFACKYPIAMQMQYSTDGGLQWVTLGNDRKEYGSVNWYNRGGNSDCYIVSPVFENQMGWTYMNYDNIDESVDDENTEHKLSFLKGQPNVSFRFVVSVLRSYPERYYVGDGFMIDDFEIEKGKLAPAVAQFEASELNGCSGHVVTFSSTSTGALKDFSWDFGAGASPAHAEGIGPHLVTYTVESETLSTVRLTVIDYMNGEATEEKTDFIATAPKHTPFITQQGEERVTSTLVASEGDSFMWSRNNLIIEGAVERTYVATQSGVYYVQVTKGGCARYSKDLEIEIITSIDKSLLSAVSIFPNPSYGTMTIDAGELLGTKKQLVIKLYDLSGRPALIKSLSDQKTELDLNALSKGTYLMEISDGTTREAKRIILK